MSGQSGQPTQELPYWLSASTYYLPNPTGGTESILSTTVVNLPLTYYGPSIPLAEGWTYGGLTSSPPSATTLSQPDASSTLLATDSAVTTPSPSSLPPQTGSTPQPSTASSTSLSSSWSSASSTSTPSSSASLTSASLTSASLTSASSSFSGSFTSNATASSTSNATASSTSTIIPQPPVEPASIVRKGLSTASIVAIGIGSAIALVCLLLIILACIKRRRRRGRARGHDLQVDTSALPPGIGEGYGGERGRLLAGRDNGGESPEMVEPDGSRLPVPASYNRIRPREPDTEISPQVLSAIGTAPAEQASSNRDRSPSSSGGSRGTGGTVSSSDLFYQYASPVEGATLMTAQRATRHPFARLARISWFGRNRTARSSPLGENGDSQEDMSDWVTIPSPSQRRPPDTRRHSTPLLVSRRILPNPELALEASQQPVPPPSALLIRPPDESKRSRLSAQSSQTGQTIYYDAQEAPPSPALLPKLPSLQVAALGSETKPPEGRRTSTPDFSNVSPSVPWPTFPSPPISPLSDIRSTTYIEEPDDVLDQPPPTPAFKIDSLSGRSAPNVPSRLSRAWDPDSGSEEENDALLEEEPPNTADAWTKSLRADLSMGIHPDEGDQGPEGLLRGEHNLGHQGSMRRLTLGQAVFIDTPRISPSHDIASLRGDRGGGTIGSNSADSRYSAARSNLSNLGQSSSSSRPHQPGFASAPRPSSELSTYSSGRMAPRMHSLSALRGAAFRSRDTAISASTQGELDSLLHDPDSTLTAPSEMGELSPKKDRQFDSTPPSPEKLSASPSKPARPPRIAPSKASAQALRFSDKPTGRVPSPPSVDSATDAEFRNKDALSPPPPKAWWKPR